MVWRTEADRLTRDSTQCASRRVAEALNPHEEHVVGREQDVDRATGRVGKRDLPALVHEQSLQLLPGGANLLLTSYGWHNVYTHGDPSAATALLAVKDPAVRVLVPADPGRLAMVLDEAFGSRGQLNIVVAGKHSRTQFPMTTIEEELTRGLAIWPHLSDHGEPDVTIATAGDLPAQVVAEAVEGLRKARRCRIRVVNLTDLTVLGNPAAWPRGLSIADIDHYFGVDAGLLVVTLGHPAAVWRLLEGRLRRPVEVIGWRDPAGPVPQAELARTAGLDADGLDEAVARLLGKRAESW